MSKKHVITPRKSPRLVETTSTDEIHAPAFNILTQTLSPKKNEISAKGCSSQSKNQITQKEKNSQAKKTISPANQKGKKSKGKIVETHSDSDSNFSQSDPLEVKHMKNVPQQDETSNNRVFDMRSIDIDAKYHRQRYATIICHYGKIKNDDDAISESEVTETVASKFGGPRIVDCNLDFLELQVFF
ncbi:hypothetical protein H5410_033770 [Solanum commersonii]|uniref:Uncharacterized protein n=1 Tax=Solanum commersonii TaxID=4109 RepID=A0A9J5YRR0_SOLCO|nr:hypothetical protein H5410_033770 [Solanum commersonii]